MNNKSADNPRLDDTLIENLRIRYEKTENTLYVWEAIRICTGQVYGEKRPLPDWCLIYLATAADNIYKLSKRIDFLSSDNVMITWAKALERAPAALGLSGGKNQNAFKNADADETKWKAAVRHDWELTQVEGKSAREAKEILHLELGVPDPENLKKKLQGGRKLGVIPKREKP